MEQTFERVVLEERPDRVTVRVRSADWLPTVRRIVVLAVGLGLVVSIGLPPNNDVLWTLAGVFAWLFFLVPTGIGTALRGARRRSEYNRLSSLFEVCRAKGTAGPARVTVDGKSYACKDFLGVIVAHSSEWTNPPGRYAKPRKLLRAAPTLVFRDRLYELDVYEDGDVPRANELGDILATMLSRRETKSPRLTWQYAQFGIQFPVFLAMFAVMIIGVGVGLLRGHHLWLARLLIVVGVVADHVGANFAEKEFGSRRTRAARTLREDAQRALKAIATSPP